MIAWSFRDIDAALRFYQACWELGIEDELGRIEILTIFAMNNEMTNVMQTERSKDAFVADLISRYKVLDLRKDKLDERIDAVWVKDSETGDEILIDRNTNRIIGRR